jgi:Putative peptidoglycan binding domain/L,D-transpeptidase catalytic domain
MGLGDIGRGVGAGRVRTSVRVVVGAMLTAAVLAGCSAEAARGVPPPSGPASTTTGRASASTATPATTPTGTPEPTATPATTTTGTPEPTSGPASAPAPAAAPAGLLRPGDAGPQVRQVQQRLVVLGYWLGTPDGHYGDLTAQAVTALQKVAGLDRDGVVGPRTRGALDAGVRPSARSSGGHVVEVDLRHQVLLVVDGGRVSRVLNTSTGSGEYYTAPDGHRAHAVTPPGHFGVFRSVDGWDTSPLGHLYRPRYFNGGIAVHGYPSVPPFPASHGCVRVSVPAMDMIWTEGLLASKAAVWVY